MTSKPTTPPTDGAAVEQPPNNGPWKPQVTVYPYGLDAPSLWIYWPDLWQLADVRAKHEYQNGLVVYQVELAMPNPDGAAPSRVIRSFAWGKDNIRPA